MKNKVYKNLIISYLYLVSLFIIPLSHASNESSNITQIPLPVIVDFINGEDYESEVHVVPINSNSPKPIDEIIKFKGSEKKVINFNKFMDTGHFEYDIYEINKKDSDIIYDDTIYRFTVIVQNDISGNLINSAYLRKDNDDSKKVSEVYFKNVNNKKELPIKNENDNKENPRSDVNKDNTKINKNSKNVQTGVDGSSLYIIILILSIIILLSLRKKSNKALK